MKGSHRVGNPFLCLICDRFFCNWLIIKQGSVQPKNEERTIDFFSK